VLINAEHARAVGRMPLAELSHQTLLKLALHAGLSDPRAPLDRDNFVSSQP
jgi:hypothetical protein